MPRGCFEPRLIRNICEKRQQGGAHAVVVGVEPGDFLARKQLFRHGAQVDGAKRKRFEGEKLAEIGCAVLMGEQHVFDAHAKAVAHINARLVSHGHAVGKRHEGAGAAVLAYLSAGIEK